MKRKGRNWLISMGILEVLLGLGSFFLMRWLLGQDLGSYQFYGIDAVNITKDALWILVLIYATAFFQVVFGLLGIIFANSEKKANACRIFGLILIMIQVFNFSHGHGNFDATSIIINLLLGSIPALYYYGACLNMEKTK